VKLRSRTPWLVRPRPRAEAKMRLFCFPYAGGSAAVFREWSERLGPSVEVWSIEYPGRGTRRSEKPFNQLSPLVDALLPELRSELTVPFAFFGHSMGALVALEILERLAMEDGPEAMCFFPSACRPPWCEARRPPTFDLPEPEFIQEVIALGGTPEELLADKTLAELFLPFLRADFQAAQTYSREIKVKLRCPILVYGGLDDPDVSREDLSRWQDVCETSSVRMFPGDHFYLHSAMESLMRVLSRDLSTRMVEVGKLRD
jgi:medium-chain acyl-[acyl-carrier-protein] hydrolase